jgi:ABC-type transport system substrate-binding protein
MLKLTQPGHGWSLMMNVNKAPTDDLQVRKAIALASDPRPQHPGTSTKHKRQTNPRASQQASALIGGAESEQREFHRTDRRTAV